MPTENMNAFAEARQKRKDAEKMRRQWRQYYAESTLGTNLKSDAGAEGPWQIMPITKKDYLTRGKGKDGDVYDYDYAKQIRDFALDTVSRDLGSYWRDDSPENINLMKRYAGYNMGGRGLKNALKKAEAAGIDVYGSDAWLDYVPTETRNYVNWIVNGQDIAGTALTLDNYRNAWGKYRKDPFVEDIELPNEYMDDLLQRIVAANVYATSHIAPGREFNGIRSIQDIINSVRQKHNPQPQRPATFLDILNRVSAASGNTFDTGGPKKSLLRTIEDPGIAVRDNTMTRSTEDNYGPAYQKPLYIPAPRYTQEEWDAMYPAAAEERNHLENQRIAGLAASAAAFAPFIVGGLGAATEAVAANPGLAVGLLSGETTNEAIKKYTPYRSWGDAVIRGTGADKLMGDMLLTDDQTALVNGLAEFTNPFFGAGEAAKPAAEILSRPFIRREIPFQSNRFYRVVGKDAIEDANRTGIIRSNKSEYNGTPYFERGKSSWLSSNKNRVIEGKQGPTEWVRAHGSYGEYNPTDVISEGSIRGVGDDVVDAFPILNGNTQVPTTGFTYWQKSPFLGWVQRPFDKAKGGPIHIKPENRGKFTALKKRTGHSATWFKAHGTPAQRKMATFALNSKKWHHADGGLLDRMGAAYGNDYTKIREMLQRIRASR